MRHLSLVTKKFAYSFHIPKNSPVQTFGIPATATKLILENSDPQFFFSDDRSQLIFQIPGINSTNAFRAASFSLILLCAIQFCAALPPTQNFIHFYFIE